MTAQSNPIKTEIGVSWFRRTPTDAPIIIMGRRRRETPKWITGSPEWVFELIRSATLVRADATMEKLDSGIASLVVNPMA